MVGETYLSREGYEKLRTELERLQGPERRKFSKAIGQARLHGDLKENAEYHAAKDAQAHNEARIAELESKLTNVRIIDNEDIPKDKIFIGAKATLHDLEMDEKIVYTLVGPDEADYAEGKISIHSPVGKSLLSKKVGDEVTIDVPAGVLRYKVLKIER